MPFIEAFNLKAKQKKTEERTKKSIASIRLKFERMETCTRLRKLIAHRSFCDIYHV